MGDDRLADPHEAKKFHQLPENWTNQEASYSKLTCSCPSLEKTE